MAIPIKEIREGTLLREEIVEKIRRLESRSGRGLWAMAIFLMFSILAWRYHDLLSYLPQRAAAILGAPPPTGLISAALIVYVFAAIILILTRMATGAEAAVGFSHVGYLAGFYFFYSVAGAMEENFWAVLVAGITILGLQSYHLWTHCVEQVRMERETLAEFDRKAKFAALYSDSPEQAGQ
jgi:hypothetical protein